MWKSVDLLSESYSLWLIEKIGDPFWIVAWDERSETFPKPPRSIHINLKVSQLHKEPLQLPRTNLC